MNERPNDYTRVITIDDLDRQIEALRAQEQALVALKESLSVTGRCQPAAISKAAS